MEVTVVALFVLVKVIALGVPIEFLPIFKLEPVARLPVSDPDPETYIAPAVFVNEPGIVKAALAISIAPAFVIATAGA